VHFVGFYYKNFRNLYKLQLLYIIDIHDEASARLRNVKSKSLSLATGFKIRHIVLPADGTLVPNHARDTSVIFIYN